MNRFPTLVWCAVSRDEGLVRRHQKPQTVATLDLKIAIPPQFQVGIQISNIGSIAILWLVYMGYITEGKCFQSSFILHAHQFTSAFLVLSAGLSICALSVFPIV
jgi:hypothetical protein